MTKTIIIAFFVLLAPINIFSQVKYYKDNQYLINEIGIQSGGYLFEDAETFYVTLEGATFFVPNVGVRSGVTVYGSAMNAGWGIKIPVYAAFRTANQTEEYDPMAKENIDNNLLKDITYSILSDIPAKLEFNIGPSIGYVSPKSWARSATITQKRNTDDYFVHARMSLSLDANIRATCYIDRVGLNLNLGGAYWITNNFKYYSIEGDEDNGKVSRWMGNIGLGLTFRF